MEFGILIILNLVYEHLRNLVPFRQAEAQNRAQQVWQFTQQMHWDVELGFNQFVASHAVIAHAFNAYYTYLHLPVTAATLLWIFRVHKRAYRATRSVLVITTVLGLAGFYLFPMAPPRLLHGGSFIDTLVEFGTWGSWSSPTVASQTNQYAAMPSLHCAWALWVGMCLFFLARRRWLRIIGVLYPICTFTVVVGTANHFILDGVAGAAILAVAFATQRILYGQSSFAPAATYEELTLTPEPEKPGHRLQAPLPGGTSHRVSLERATPKEH